MSAARKLAQHELPPGYADIWQVEGHQADRLKEGGPFRGMVGRSLGYERRGDLDVVRLRFADGREETFTPHQLFPVQERTLFIDPDFRPTPKTKHFCCVCQRDIKSDAAHRIVFLRPDEGFTQIDRPAAPSEKAVRHPVGMNCAKKIGLEWSIAP